MCVERNDKNQRWATPTTGAASFWGAWAGGRLQRELEGGGGSKWCYSTQPVLVAAAAAAAVGSKQAAQSSLKSITLWEERARGVRLCKSMSTITLNNASLCTHLQNLTR